MRYARTSLVVIAAAGLLAAGCGGSTKKIAGLTANDHGSKDVSAGGTVALEVDNYYFSPTLLTGKPGEKVTVHITNDTGTAHNFTIESQHINKDIAPKTDATLTVTFPQSGVLSFFCEYHRTRGMAGGLKAS
ncbi:MAG: cupredoxin domain-containing protein [Frankiales bacterium]|nr:cupredoxin domain-containing protein [Frankiales bacterium]